MSVSLSLVLLASAETGSAREHAKPVHDLRYGEALYDFYQDQYFRAITDIMVAQARSPIATQGNDPQLLLGSLYLSYGMEKDASGIFEPLLSAKTEPFVHDLAWFYVGRMRYLDGRYAEAVEAFKSISGSLPDAKQAERLHLMVNSYLHNGKYDDAIKILNSIDSEGIWNYYSRYNLGIAFIRSNHIKEGISLLDQLNRMSPVNEEEYAVRDKANIALGYTEIHKDSAQDPIASFSRVRLNGPFSNQALLGLGWAYNVNKQPQEALKPWAELSSREAADPSSQEALIAIAYTMEQLQQPKLALSYYDKAISIYDQVRAELETSLANVKYDDLLRSSIPSSYAADEKWPDAGIRLSNLPAAKYLDRLLTSREFQKAYRDYRDLNYLRLQAAHWAEKIPLLRIMLEERRRQYTINVAHIKGTRYEDRINDLSTKRARLADEISKIEEREAIDQLATPDEWDTLNRLREIKDKLDKIAAQGIDVKAELKEQRLLYGLMQWKLHTEYPARLWRVKKGLHELDEALAQNAQARSSLENLLRASPLNFNGFADRITDQELYLKNLSKKLGDAVHKQEQYCSRLIIDALTQQLQQVDLRKTKALYAQARLYDLLSHMPETP